VFENNAENRGTFLILSLSEFEYCGFVGILESFRSHFFCYFVCFCPFEVPVLLRVFLAKVLSCSESGWTVAKPTLLDEIRSKEVSQVTSIQCFSKLFHYVVQISFGSNCPAHHLVNRDCAFLRMNQHALFESSDLFQCAI